MIFVGTVGQHTPWKINMEPTNHPFRKKMIFQTSMIMFHLIFQGCISCTDACDTSLVVFPWVGKSEVRKDRTVESSMNPWSGYSVGCGVWIQVWLWNRQGLQCGSKAISWLLPSMASSMHGYPYIIYVSFILFFRIWFSISAMWILCPYCWWFRNPKQPAPVMNGINGSQPQLVKLSMMSGSEPSKEPRSWSYAWWILGTLCEGPTFQRFNFVECVSSSGKGTRYK